MSAQKWAVGITGASGAVYGVRLVRELLRGGHTVHLMITEAGWQVFRDELDWNTDDREALIREKLQQDLPGALHYWGMRDFNCPAASGSYRCDGMVVVPCSMGTLSGIAHGASGNLLERVADVMLKERRRLVLVPRETPLNAIQLENMLKLSRLGVTILPAMPGYYHKPQTMDDLVNFVVGKALDALDVPHELFRRWGNKIMQKSLRIGQILYTNVLPVYFYFDQERFEDRIDFIRQVPAQLNRAMARGEIDLGPISSFSYAEHASRYLALADLSVSAKGRVGSIFLFSKRPIEALDGARIALTNTSATSVNLLKIILQTFYGLNVSYVTQEPVLAEMMRDADGALLIGDDAIFAYRQGGPYHVYDLGELWHRFTGYTMTFALWAVRKEVIGEQADLLREVHEAFLASKEKTRQNLDPLVDYVHGQFGGEKEHWRQYFRGLVHDFRDEQRTGLEYYYRCAAELGLLPEPVTVSVWEHPGCQSHITLTK